MKNLQIQVTELLNKLKGYKEKIEDNDGLNYTVLSSNSQLHFEDCEKLKTIFDTVTGLKPDVEEAYDEISTVKELYDEIDIRSLRDIVSEDNDFYKCLDYIENQEQIVSNNVAESTNYGDDLDVSLDCENEKIEELIDDKRKKLLPLIPTIIHDFEALVDKLQQMEDNLAE